MLSFGIMPAGSYRGLVRARKGGRGQNNARPETRFRTRSSQLDVMQASLRAFSRPSWVIIQCGIAVDVRQKGSFRQSFASTGCPRWAIRPLFRNVQGDEIPDKYPSMHVREICCTDWSPKDRSSICYIAIDGQARVEPPAKDIKGDTAHQNTVSRPEQSNELNGFVAGGEIGQAKRAHRSGRGARLEMVAVSSASMHATPKPVSGRLAWLGPS